MEMSRLAGGPEFDFIRAVLQNASTSHPLVRVGPGDDCALVGELALSIDASVENTHFRRAWLSPPEIGWRAVAAALSDLAAVAAEPVGVLVSIVMPPGDRAAYAENAMQGAIEAAEANGAVLLGGDTTAGLMLALDVVAVGRAVPPVLRSGAKAGDEVWVTGRLGGAAAAVSAWLAGGNPAAAARARYARPQPRIREALWLRERLALNALIDLSDGLLGDVAHIASASDCRIIIDSASVPIDAEAGATYTQAVSGGEDYELCFTTSPGQVDQMKAAFEQTFNVALTRVGSVEQGSGVAQRAPDGSVSAVEARGYQHFQDKRP
jgi:thiamine-monophosphate kinase